MDIVILLSSIFKKSELFTVLTYNFDIPSELYLIKSNVQ